MSVVESLVQSPSGQRQLRLMTLLAELEPVDRDHQVEIDALENEPERFGFSSSSLEGDLEAMKEWGWVEFWPTMEGIGSVMVKQPGLDVADEFKVLKANPRRRAQEIRDAILNWLYDEHVSGGHALGISDFLKSSKNQYFGDPYSEEELARAARWLLDEEYVDGFKTMGPELLRPSITTKGMRVIETEQSVNRALTTAGITVNEVNITGSQGVNVSVASSNVTQSNTLTQGQIDEVAKMLGSVRAIMTPTTAGVTEDVAAQAQFIAGQLEEEIKSPSPQSSVVKALGIKLMELAATGTVQGVVDALNTIIQQGIGGI